MNGLNLKKELKKEKQKSFDPLNWDFISKNELLTPEKIAFAKLEVDVSIMTGGKGSGKNLVALLETAIELENEPYAHAWLGRKNKELAKDNTMDYLISIVNELGILGYTTRYLYEKKRSRIYLMNNKDINQNSFVLAFSLDDYVQTDGARPPNNGFINRMIVDEPVIRTDMGKPDKIPSPEEWESVISHLRSNLTRHNERYEKLFKLEKPIHTKEWYLLNNWGDHPIVVQAQELFSDNEFIKLITGYDIAELVGNAELLRTLTRAERDADGGSLGIETSPWYKMWTTRSFFYKVHTEQTGRKIAVSKATWFANPDNLSKPKKVREALLKIAEGFLHSRFALLAHWAGLKYIPLPDSDLLVYNIQSFNETTFEALLKEGYVPTKLSWGLDIDTSRVLTITPTWQLERKNIFLNRFQKVIKIWFIDQLIEIPASGSGSFGEMHKIYAKTVCNHIKKMFLKSLKIPEVDAYLQRTWAVIDDDRRHYLGYIRDQMTPNIITNYLPAVKQGHYEIVHRQDMLENAFNNKKLYMHKNNKLLMQDIRQCMKATPNALTRVTSGTINKLDRIDSLEYSLYVYHLLLNQAGRATKWKKQQTIRSNI